MLYKTESAGVTSQLNIRINGVQVDIFTLTGSSGVYTTSSIDVVDGDYAEIGYVSGTAPDKGIYTLLLELTL